MNTLSRPEDAFDHGFLIVAEWLSIVGNQAFRVAVACA